MLKMLKIDYFDKYPVTQRQTYKVQDIPLMLTFPLKLLSWYQLPDFLFKMSSRKYYY